MLDQLIDDQAIPKNYTKEHLEEVEVVLTMAPDEGSMKDDDAVEVGYDDPDVGEGEGDAERSGITDDDR